MVTAPCRCEKVQGPEDVARSSPFGYTSQRAFTVSALAVAVIPKEAIATAVAKSEFVSFILRKSPNSKGEHQIRIGELITFIFLWAIAAMRMLLEQVELRTQLRQPNDINGAVQAVRQIEQTTQPFR